MAKVQPLESASDGSPTRALAEFVAGFSYKNLPSEVVSHIKFCLLDSLGCALFGSTLPWGKIITSFTKELGKGKGALIWGDGSEVPSTSAPLANGTLIHSFEMDDLHRVGVIHPGSEAIPAADALVRHVGNVDGKRFLTAVAVGYEVGCRVGMTGGAAQLRRGFHPSATSGTFAAGAAAAKMLRLNPVKTIHALGIAGTQAAGLMAAQHASMVKRMHPGRSAQAGVYGALLAQKGFTGIEDVLEAPYGGFCSTFIDKPNLFHLTDRLGERFETLNVGFKPYPCCGSNHTSIDALTAEAIAQLIAFLHRQRHPQGTLDRTFDPFDFKRLDQDVPRPGGQRGGRRCAGLGVSRRFRPGRRSESLRGLAEGGGSPLGRRGLSGRIPRRPQRRRRSACSCRRAPRTPTAPPSAA